MPGTRTHLVCGISLGAAAWYALRAAHRFDPSPTSLAALAACVALGSVFPDVDTDSKARRFFYAALFVLDAALLLSGQVRWAAVLGLVAMLPAMGAHRGWTHRWWAALVVPLAVLGVAAWLFSWPPLSLGPYYAATVLGYASHLVVDRLF
ncbi:MAG: hypothetical protein JG774_1696 [Desulfomicrobiaceae bacterium]|jgi:membrane-bound metal-dependent hydrolase YbcI (DUF457 family)|nr:hypothetical protein [Desulfomicrobiaceae bacterium]